MKIVADTLLHVSEFGRRTPRTDSLRWYYQVVGYDDLVLVCHDQDYRAWSGRAGIVLVEARSIDGSIICQQFPKAPARWRGRRDLVAITVRADRRRTRGQRMALSRAIHDILGPPSIGVID